MIEKRKKDFLRLGESEKDAEVQKLGDKKKAFPVDQRLNQKGFLAHSADGNDIVVA